MALVTCPECGKEVSEQAENCVNCGYPIKRKDTVFCTSCGKIINKQAIVCPHCGAATSNYQSQQAQAQAPINVTVSNVNTNTNTNINKNVGGHFGRPKNKWVSLVLCIFLGGIGAHKFYEGKIGMGILYLFTFGLIGIGVIIDFIALLFKPNPYYV